MTDITTLNDMQAARRARLRLLSTSVRYVLLFAVGLVMLYPLIWLVGASFKTNSEIFSGAGFIPENPTLDGYIRGWETSTPYTFGRFFWNSFLIILPKVIGTAISCTMAAYAFARFDFPLKKILFGSVIAILLLPNVVTRIPQYILFRDLGWLAPALISVCLFQFMWTMNDFLGPLIYLSSVDKYPVSLALKLSIDTTEAFEWNRILAMSVLTIAPALIVFFAAQRYFIEGISSGGVKG